MAQWPLTLPTYPDDGGFEEQLDNLLLITQTSIGPPKVRKKATSGPIIVTAKYTLTASQLEDFVDFFLNSISGGKDIVVWPHPRLEYLVNAWFLEIPTYSSTQYDQFELQIRLEVEYVTEITGWFAVGWFRGWL